MPNDADAYLSAGDGGWEMLSRRLGTIRAMRGMPGLRCELQTYSGLRLLDIYEKSLTTILKAGTEELVMAIAFDVVLCIQDIRKERNDSKK